MKTKSIIFAAVLITALFGQLNAQPNEKSAENLPPESDVDSANATQETPEANLVFDFYKYDFGTIKESDGKVSTVFTFTNWGNSPLIISKVVASCGCSAAEWTQEPVAPGEQGRIKAIYDPTNRINFFSKSLTVYSNGNPSEIVLTIQGTTVKELCLIERR